MKDPEENSESQGKYGEPWAPFRAVQGPHGGYLTRVTGVFAGERVCTLSETEYERARQCVNLLKDHEDLSKIKITTDP